MSRHSYTSDRRRAAGRLGRVVFALAAGVGFAVLAYEPPRESPATNDDKLSNETDPAQPQRVVREDDALRQTELSQAGWTVPGRARMRSSDDIWSQTVDGEAADVTQARKATAVAQAARGQGPAITVSPNSRGPP